MPKMYVNKSVEINSPVDRIYSIIGDFNNWRPWSPWLILDPDCSLDIEEGGKAYSWKGERIGSGEMSITKEDENNRIDMDLTFLTPWKSKAKVWFLFHSNGDSTRVEWYMESSIPFFMFWMKKMMTVLVGMDYERGLTMLKDYSETGSVPFEMKTESAVDYPGCTYIGINTDCSIDHIGPAMEKDFAALRDYIDSGEVEAIGEPFAQYHKWQMSKGKTNYTAGFPVAAKPENLPGNFVYGEIPSTRVFSIKLTGPYRFIGNGWSLGQNLMRAKVFKPHKKIHPFESYGNDPAETPENELVTRIMFPLA